MTKPEELLAEAKCLNRQTQRNVILAGIIITTSLIITIINLYQGS